MTKAKDMPRPWVLQAMFLMFMYLKLSGQIDWSWWQVAVPMIIAAVIGLYRAFAIVTPQVVEEARKELENE